MGSTVYDAGPTSEGAHVYAHSRKDGKEGMAYLVINNSLTGTTTVAIPKAAEVYTLSADDLRSPIMKLNGRDLVLGGDNSLPAMEAIIAPVGFLELAPATCTFIVL